MIGQKLDVRCQMPDVDAVCSAGHSTDHLISARLGGLVQVLRSSGAVSKICELTHFHNNYIEEVLFHANRINDKRVMHFVHMLISKKRK